MTIEKNILFDNSLDEILDYIAVDNLDRAIAFNRELESKFYDLPYMPYKFRTSIYFDDEKIWDFIFRGYVIPYLIDDEADKIILLGIVKYRGDMGASRVKGVK
ncbi:MAG: type II toxin-antitoxin system RelE/ParE family toxin [Campylobacterota bacterium]|nr:type II toxin-antitoxin system RelE/ParE family toxin [Campylobacterota bacterium]